MTAVKSHVKGLLASHQGTELGHHIFFRQGSFVAGMTAQKITLTMSFKAWCQRPWPLTSHLWPLTSSTCFQSGSRVIVPSIFYGNSTHDVILHRMLVVYQPQLQYQRWHWSAERCHWAVHGLLDTVGLILWWLLEGLVVSRRCPPWGR